MHYVIDTTKKTLEVHEYDKDTIDADMAFFGVKSVKDLDDPNWKVFNSYKKANKFLLDFNKILTNLDNKKICKDRSLNCLLYKRRFIVQTLMKQKNCTVRHYFKDFKKDQLINLHDQTYFLTVKIKSVVKLPSGHYQYNFELP